MHRVMGTIYFSLYLLHRVTHLAWFSSRFFVIHFIGVNTSERKIETERTKKREKRELVFLSTPGGATGTVLHRLDGARIFTELR